ncbi:hypothetical protein BCR42DRAFT_415600 [Absidia repens]|uniref:Uncharacterized protein n=1 Tax=Absidia repens TaxID=90262 RepID=A0A1X2IFH4_9FUNG|nr:hypothetical protein BCR42DRAFT_415600 [Absidia repens]
MFVYERNQMPADKNLLMFSNSLFHNAHGYPLYPLPIFFFLSSNPLIILLFSPALFKRNNSVMVKLSASSAFHALLFLR